MNADHAFPRHWALFAGVALILILPSFIWSSGFTDSFKYNYIWTSQFGAEMARGHLYPRWLPGSFQGLGSPTFYFYPPLAYWIAGGFDALGLPTVTAVNLTAFAALALSGFAMYQWLALRGTWPRVGAILYMATPYHLMDFYVRGALAEFVAFIWLPWIALSIHHLPRRRGIVGLALSYAGLILTHLPLAMLTTFFLIGPLAIHAMLTDRRRIVPMLIGGVLGLALSAFYLLGAMTLLGATSSTLLWSQWYRAASWSLFAPNSPLRAESGFLALAAGIVLLCLRTRSVWTAITVFAAVNALGLIPGVWTIPPLSSAQFPWRLLSIVEFAGITTMLRRQTPVLLGLGGGLVLFAYGMWVPETISNLTTPVPYARLVRDMPDAPEYLPAGFDARLVRVTDREVDLRSWRHLPRGDEILVTRPGEVSFGRAAFPIWRVIRDGREIRYRGPIIHFDALPGRYTIERHMIWQEGVGAAVSMGAALLLLAVGLGRRRLSTLCNGDRATRLRPLPS
jgi:hypothetical protein